MVSYSIKEIGITHRRKIIMELPKRKRTRLQGYDYGIAGAYFISICTKERRQILSEIVGGDAHIAPENKLSELGEVCKQKILNIDKTYENVTVEKYVIMPNHIHLLLQIHGSMWASTPTKTVSDVIRSFKIMVSKEIKIPIFQRSFHDHIIRDKKDYEKIWEYIDTNPIKWQLDCFYTEG